MKYPKDTICIRDVNFQKTSEQTFKKTHISKLLFFIISQSGAIDAPGNIYFFTSDKAYFMSSNEYTNEFIDKILENTKEWNLINLYFCDYLIINPKIYNSFVKELCARNIRDYWFDSAIDIYKNKLFII